LRGNHVKFVPGEHKKAKKSAGGMKRTAPRRESPEIRAKLTWKYTSLTGKKNIRNVVWQKRYQRVGRTDKRRGAPSC